MPVTGLDCLAIVLLIFLHILKYLVYDLHSNFQDTHMPALVFLLCHLLEKNLEVP